MSQIRQKKVRLLPRELLSPGAEDLTTFRPPITSESLVQILSPRLKQSTARRNDLWRAVSHLLPTRCGRLPFRQCGPRHSAELVTAGKLIAVTHFDSATCRVQIQLPFSPKSAYERRAKCRLALRS